MKEIQNKFLFVFGLIVLSALPFSTTASAQSEPQALKKVVDDFLAARCHKSIQLKSTASISETPREIARGEYDYIYDVELRVSWQTDQGRNIEETLTLNVVNLARSVDYAWFVFDGSGQVCNFKGLPGYSR